MPETPVHVIGATGRTGMALCAALLADQAPFVPVVRDADKWSQAPFDVPPRVADLADGDRLRDALGDATRIVSVAHASYAGAIVDAAPETAKLVLTGSTRKFTRWPDDHGRGVLAGEATFLRSGRSGVIVHPTMIYGATGENNVQRLAALLRRLPIVPLPGAAGRVQPIFQQDVVRALRASLDRDWDGPHSLVVAGPDVLPYAGFVEAVAAAAGLPRPRIVKCPMPLVFSAALAARLLPFLPSIEFSAVRRLSEDKAFDIGPMRSELGFEPISLAQGLAETFHATA